MTKEVFEDLLSRFLLNLPEEEVQAPERLFFHVEEAYWFYCDFFYEADMTLPQHSLKSFASEVFAYAPWLLPNGKSAEELYSWFMSYKSTVPVCGVIIFNEEMSKVLMIQHWNGNHWSFPRGKIARDESKLECAERELWEETGFRAPSGLLSEQEVISVWETSHEVTMFILRGVPESTWFEPQVRKEVRAVAWHELCTLPHVGNHSGGGGGISQFSKVKQILKSLSQWLKEYPRDQPQRAHKALPSFETNIVAALEARGVQSTQIAALLPPPCSGQRETPGSRVATKARKVEDEPPTWVPLPSLRWGTTGGITEQQEETIDSRSSETSSSTPPSSPGLSASSSDQQQQQVPAVRCGSSSDQGSKTCCPVGDFLERTVPDQALESVESPKVIHNQVANPRDNLVDNTNNNSSSSFTFKFNVNELLSCFD